MEKTSAFKSRYFFNYAAYKFATNVNIKKKLSVAKYWWRTFKAPSNFKRSIIKTVQYNWYLFNLYLIKHNKLLTATGKRPGLSFIYVSVFFLFYRNYKGVRKYPKNRLWQERILVVFKHIAIIYDYISRVYKIHIINSIYKNYGMQQHGKIGFKKQNIFFHFRFK